MTGQLIRQERNAFGSSFWGGGGGARNVLSEISVSPVHPHFLKKIVFKTKAVFHHGAGV
jgi:hypothetical protein